MAKFDNILQTIGHTPVVRVTKLVPAHVNLFVKIEAFNPMGSVKDRLALGIIEDAERTGKLKPGQTVIEATSGNTGIGLAMVCAQKGYPLVVVMSEQFSIERRKMMRFLGAKVVLTPAWQKGTGMLAKAVELADTHGWFLCRQFDNEANADMHSRTTAVEILEDFKDQPLHYWVCGAGTGGTLKGVARVLKKQRPETQIVVVEPDTSQTLGSGVAQPRRPDGTPAGSHVSSHPHLIQGITADFIPKLAEDAIALKLIDRIIPVDSGEAMRLSRELAQQEGIFTGISGGAMLVGALQICRSAPEGTTVLCMLPDTGERYLSTHLFADIGADMSAEELEVSRSTPNYRFDAPPPVAPQASPAPVAPPIEIPAAITEHVAKILAEPARPVVMVSFTWCEFCGAVRNLFKACDIEYRSVDLDSAEYATDNREAQVRAAFKARSGSLTIPQLFIGGEFVGGASETFDAFKDGRLQKLLTKHHVHYNADVSLDPYTLLPNWLQSRKTEPAKCAVPAKK